jgi:hypothetical protein
MNPVLGAPVIRQFPLPGNWFSVCTQLAVVPSVACWVSRFGAAAGTPEPVGASAADTDAGW